MWKALRSGLRVSIRAPIANLPLCVPDTGEWYRSDSFRIPSAGSIRLPFNLTKLPHTVDVYRNLLLTALATP